MRPAVPDCGPVRATLIVAALLAALWPASSQAVTVDALTVTKKGPRYRVDMQVKLDATAGRAFDVFTHYDNLPRINGAVKQVRPLPGAAADAQRLYTQMRLCFSFFCRSLEQVQDMRATPTADGGSLSASVVPAQSDLHYGQADWSVGRCAQGTETCLSFVAELEPKFWIPPLIGPWVMERKLRQEAIQTSEGIERLARAAAP